MSFSLKVVLQRDEGKPLVTQMDVSVNPSVDTESCTLGQVNYLLGFNILVYEMVIIVVLATWWL